MRATVSVEHLVVDKVLYDFVNHEAIPGTGVQERPFWGGFSALVQALAPRNSELLLRRDELQSKIDAWHRQSPGAAFDCTRYKEYLLEIGYLVPENQPFAVDTAGVDPEIAQIAGPQLVVPVSNARYALNVANARWGSLYDALYGTDAIAADGSAAGGNYNPQRGAKVIAFARDFLDEHFALDGGTHHEAAAYRLAAQGLEVQLNGGRSAGLRNPAAFRGYQGDRGAPTALLLVHHGLHVELRVDRAHSIGRDDPAGICDVLLESALTTIQDCEDSVAAVDADDKIHLYRNWLGLMDGSLQANIEKNGRAQLRSLNADRRYRTPSGGDLVLPGRSLMLVRNVGHHMMTDTVTL